MLKLHYELHVITKTMCKEPLAHQKYLPFSLDGAFYNYVMLWANTLLCFFGLWSGEITFPKMSAYNMTQLFT